MIRDGSLARFRPWLYAACLYNLGWGAMTVVFPGLLFRLVGMPAPSYLSLWQVVGMLVLVYAVPYWWAARHPTWGAHLVALGLAGKVLGAAGFVWAATTGALPLPFGLTIVANDLIWIPVFILFLFAARRSLGGWQFLLGGPPVSPVQFATFPTAEERRPTGGDL